MIYSANRPKNIIRYSIIFSGHVQGVGFRYQTALLANELGLSGSVKNEYDGTVKVEAQGEEDQILSLISELKKVRRFKIDKIIKSKRVPLYNEIGFRITK